jgi:hypothetical protein
MSYIIGYVASCETHVENIRGSLERAGNLLKLLGVTEKCKKALWYSRLSFNALLKYLLRDRTVFSGVYLLLLFLLSYSFSSS